MPISILFLSFLSTNRRRRAVAKLVDLVLVAGVSFSFVASANRTDPIAI